MEKTDMRVVRTRTLLKNALLELLAENSLEKSPLWTSAKNR